MTASAPFTITINPANQAPQWFTTAAYGTWTQVPATNTASSVGATEWQFAAWNGATFDQDRLEFVLPACGGHRDSGDNGVRALRVGQENPSWTLLRASSNYGQGNVNASGAYPDGRPSSTHTYNRIVWANGYHWMMELVSVYESAGELRKTIWGYDRALGDWRGSSGAVPGNWGAAAIGGASPGQNSGAAAYDPVSGLIWYCNTYQSGGNGVASFNPVTGAQAAYPGNYSGSGYPWGTCVTGTNGEAAFIFGNASWGGFRVTNTATGVSTWANGIGGIGASAAGAVFHPSSRRVYIKGTNGNSLIRLDVPPNPITGTWTATTITPPGVNTGNQAQNGTYGRFNIARDMGNGESALFVCNGHTLPTYFIRVPAGGL